MAMSYIDPTDPNKLLCRAHDEPQYEGATLRTERDWLRCRSEFRLTFDCGVTLLYMPTDVEIHEEWPASISGYFVGAGDGRSNGSREIACIVIGKWEEYATQLRGGGRRDA